MADKDASERLYTVPLRKEFLKVSRIKRASRAVKTIQIFLKKHMKTDEVKISQKVNETIWIRGIHHPPSKIKLKAKREGEVVYALLPDEKLEIKKKEEKKEEAPKSALQKKAAELSEKLKKEKEAKKPKKEEKKAKSKKEEPKETKAEKK